MTEQESFGYGLIAGLIIGVIATTIIISMLFLSNPLNTQETTSINFTVIDKDISDQTFYTAQKEILTTNKYEWKTLQINHSYECSGHILFGVSNCTEISR